MNVEFGNARLIVKVLFGQINAFQNSKFVENLYVLFGIPIFLAF